MAKTKKPPELSDDDKFMATMRERFKRASEADSEQYNYAQEDMRFAFIPGEQWDETQKKKRSKRPCYEFNRLRQAIKQVVGGQRKNRPQIKLRAVDGNTDPEMVGIMSGLVKNIETVSNADRAYDTGFEYSCTGGFGAWRVKKDYVSDSAFEQELFIEELRNPFSVHFDPAAVQWDKRDGMFAFVTELISKDVFEAKYPKAEVVSFEDSTRTDGLDTWFMDRDRVRVCEYWYKQAETKTMLLMSNGETLEQTPDVESVLDDLANERGVTVVQEREVEGYCIYQCLVSGKEKLTEPVKYEGKFIPLVPVWGDMLNIGGKEIYSGMVRHSKDSARLHNFLLTTAMESVANSPKAPLILTPNMIKGYETLWQQAGKEPVPYLLYNPDGAVPGGKPFRETPADMPMALVNLAGIAGDEIKATTGIYDASLGNRSNETSGVAITARQKQGDNASFNYIDNLTRAIRFTGEILVDLIPKVYDTKRIVRIIGEDGAEKAVTINEDVVDVATGKTVRLNDLSKGRYDVTVSVGPSYATQRMEMAESLLKLTQANPMVAPIVTDLIVKNLDMPGADEAVKRLRQMMIKQGIIQPEQSDLEEMQKAPQMPPQEPPPDVIYKMQAEKETIDASVMEAKAKAAEAAARAEAARAEAAKRAAEADGAVLDNHKTAIEIEQAKTADNIDQALQKYLTQIAGQTSRAA